MDPVYRTPVDETYGQAMYLSDVSGSEADAELHPVIMKKEAKGAHS